MSGKSGLTALVTGASSGLGECMAEDLAGRGYNLILVARRAEKLMDLAARLKRDHRVDTHVLPADLSEPSSAYELADALAREKLNVDLLVNNAGVMEYAPFHELDPDKLDTLINLNARGCAAMCRAFLPEMLKRGQGRVLNMGSISAFLPMPKIATYAATKSFVLQLTEALSVEYKGTGVSFTAICPSMTETPLVAELRKTQPSATPNFLIGDASKVAREAIDACLAGKVVLVPGVPNRLAIMLTRAQPRWLLRSMLGLGAKMAGRE